MTHAYTSTDAGGFDNRRRNRRTERADAERGARQTEAKAQLEYRHTAMMSAARNCTSIQATIDDLESRETKVLSVLRQGGANAMTFGESLLAGPGKCLSSLCIDVLLLSSAARAMLGQAYRTERGPSWGLVVAVPICFLIFELAIATQMTAQARRVDAGDVQARGALWAWRVAAVPFIIAPIIMVGSPFFADPSSQANLGDRMLLIATALFAMGIHTIVLFTGSSMLPGFHRSILYPTSWSLAQRVREAEARLQQAGFTASDTVRAYSGLVDAYTAEHGPLPPHLAVQPRDAAIINAAVGAEVVATVPRPAPTPPNPDASTGAAAGAGSGAQASPEGPVPDAAPGTRPPSSAAAGTTAEAEYLQRVRDAQIRAADGEVTPDRGPAPGAQR